MRLNFTRTSVLCLYLNKSAIRRVAYYWDLENEMTIIRNGNTNKTKDFVIVGVGAAGSKSATELSKVLGNPDDVIAVDRDMEALRTLSVGRRISIGHPVFVNEEDEHCAGSLVDQNDLFRLKTVIGKPPLVFVMAGLGGATTLELMPWVLRTAMSTGASVLAVVTLPFTLEGRTRSRTAASALRYIRETGCSLAVIDADAALSSRSFAGNLATELTASKARVVMNVLSATNAATSGTLNTSPEMLDAIKCGGETFISYAFVDDVNDYRKAAREAIKHPITNGLELVDADYVSVIVAGPRDMSIKSLNSAVSIIQNEMSQEAVLSTSFIPNSDSPRSSRFRISVIAGRQVSDAMEPEAVPTVSAETESNGDVVKRSQTPDLENAVSGQIDDLFGAPDWLVDQPTTESAVAALH